VRESYCTAPPKAGEFGNRLPHAYRIFRRDVQTGTSKGVPFLLRFFPHREDLFEGDRICRGNPSVSENVIEGNMTQAKLLTARQHTAQGFQGFV